MRAKRVGLVWIGSILPALIVVNGLLAIPDFFDPCHYYGHEGEPVAPSDGCRSVRTTEQTKAEAITFLLLFHGGMAVAISTAFFFAWRGDRWSMLFPASVLFVQSWWLMSGGSGLLILGSGALYLVAAFAPLRDKEAPVPG